MKRAGLVLLLLSFSLPLVISAQQSSSTALPLSITDKQAIEEWSRSISADRVVPDGREPPNPKDPLGDTQFLLSLTDAERYGAFLFKQRCNACHGAAMNSPRSYGPRLSKTNVEGREAAARQRILEGSANMPAFRYSLQPPQVDLIVGYLKKVEPPCRDCAPGDYRR